MRHLYVQVIRGVTILSNFVLGIVIGPLASRLMGWGCARALYWQQQFLTNAATRDCDFVSRHPRPCRRLRRFLKPKNLSTPGLNPLAKDNGSGAFMDDLFSGNELCNFAQSYPPYLPRWHGRISHAKES